MSSNFNIRKEFLGTSTAWRDQGVFNPALDEPTYLTFRVKFFSDEWYTDNSYFYDTIPQALFSIGDQHNGAVCRDLDLWQPELSDVKTFIDGFKGSKLKASGFSSDRAYSALEYLYSRNEDYRCYMLAKFLKGWNDLQTKYQYYFQEISGLDELMKSDPSKGQKIEKSHTITIKCLEGIDQKVKYLYSLYKAAAWDDHYQRWILPDIYRYFKLDIYISEIRTFHQSAYADPIDPNGTYSKSLLSNLYSSNGPFAQAIDRFAGKIVDKVTGKVFSTLDEWTQGGVDNNRKEDNLILGVVSGFVPVTCIRCTLCDFDINHNIFASDYNINNDQMETTTIKVKVRNAEVMHNWQYIEPYRNLLSHTDRTIGQSTLKALVEIGANADQVFNNTFYMVEEDKNRYDTGTITSGWIMNTLNKIVEGTTKEGNKLLDMLYNGYESIRDGMAAKDAVEGNYEDSKATHANIFQIQTKDTDDKSLATDLGDASSLAFNTTSRAKMSYVLQGKDKSVATDMDNDASSMLSIEDSSIISMPVNVGHTKAVEKIINALKEDGTYATIRREAEALLAAHSADMKNSIKDQIETQKSELQGSTLYQDLLNKISYLQEISTTSLATIDTTLKTTYDTNVPISEATLESNKIISEVETIDRSFGTNLDNSTGWDKEQMATMDHVDQPNIGNEHPWSIDKADGMEDLSDVGSGSDRSEATNLDNTNEWENQKINGMQAIRNPENMSEATVEVSKDGVDLLTEVNQSDIALSIATFNVDYNRNLNLVPTPLTEVSILSIATGDPNNSDWSSQALRDMLFVSQPQDRSEATELDNQITWTNEQFSDMQIVMDSSSWSNATGEGFDPDWAKVTVRFWPHVNNENQETSLATLNPWANGAVYFMQDLNVDYDYDYSEATEFGDDLSWPETERNQMKWIDTSGDRSIATDLDNDQATWSKFARAAMYPSGVEEDRSISTNLDNLWTWDSGKIQEMTWQENIQDISEEDIINSLVDTNIVIDRSEATNLDNLENVWDLQKFEKMLNIEQGKDRSIATDLDSVPSTTTMEELQRKTEELQKTFEKSPIGNESLRDQMPNLNSSETSLFEKIAWEMASVTGGESGMSTTIEEPKLEQTTANLTDVSTALTYVADNTDLKKRKKEESKLYNEISTSLFESIATSSAQSMTHVSQETKPAAELLDIRPYSNTNKYENILMEDGTIRVTTKVSELIDVYIEDKTQKMALQEVSPIDNNNPKKTVL
jgi:hypothetical protein